MGGRVSGSSVHVRFYLFLSRRTSKIFFPVRVQSNIFLSQFRKLFTLITLFEWFFSLNFSLHNFFLSPRIAYYFSLNLPSPPFLPKSNGSQLSDLGPTLQQKHVNTHNGLARDILNIENEKWKLLGMKN